MSARGFLYELMPLLEKGKPYGHLDMDTEQLSKHFGVSLHMTRRYVFELTSHRILKKGSDGTLYCPPLIRQQFLGKK